MKRSILLLGLIISNVLVFFPAPKAMASAINQSTLVQTETLASGYTGTNEDGDRETIKTGK